MRERPFPTPRNPMNNNVVVGGGAITSSEAPLRRANSACGVVVLLGSATPATLQLAWPSHARVTPKSHPNCTYYIHELHTGLQNARLIWVPACPLAPIQIYHQQ